MTALLPVLDDASLQRAVHVAWVLAQVAPREVADRALRRLALYGLLHREDGGLDPRGEAMEFFIAPGISFRQMCVPVAVRDGDQAKVTLPGALLPPRELDRQELDFLVREYRDLLAIDAHFGLFGSAVWYELLAVRTDASWIPFFQMVAREDPRLTAWMVNGRKVAHYFHRRIAAETVARRTARPASYLAFGGETLDSEAYPSLPYAGQNHLIARLLLDRMVGDGVAKPVPGAQGWSRRGYYDELLDELVRPDDFGPELKAEILQESRSRGLFDTLRSAGLRLWAGP